MTHHIKVIESTTFRLNPSVQEPYLVDFDGDFPKTLPNDTTFDNVIKQCAEDCKIQNTNHLENKRKAEDLERVNKKPKLDNINKPIIKKQYAFDIECFSETGRFPNPTNPKDEITMIGISFTKHDNQNSNHILTTKDVNTINGVEILKYDTEEKMLNAFKTLTENSNMTTKYDVNDFDREYLEARKEFYKNDNKKKPHSRCYYSIPGMP
jgi:hypothetical protein